MEERLSSNEYIGEAGSFTTSLLPCNAIPLIVVISICCLLAVITKRERLTVFWYLFSGIVHLLLEGSYGLYHSEVRTRSGTSFIEFMLMPMKGGWRSMLNLHWWASLYNQYARYDGRYAHSDPMVIFFCMTEVVEGLICFLLAILITFNLQRYRHPIQIINSTAQFYGTCLYFVTPILYGTWGETMTNDRFELFVYVILLNAIWMIIPALLILQSIRHYTSLYNTSKRKRN